MHQVATKDIKRDWRSGTLASVYYKDGYIGFVAQRDDKSWVVNYRGDDYLTDSVGAYAGADEATRFLATYHLVLLLSHEREQPDCAHNNAACPVAYRHSWADVVTEASTQTLALNGPFVAEHLGDSTALDAWQ